MRSFDAAGGASGDANNEAVAALAGVRADDIIMAEWHTSIARPCHYVAVDHANHSIVLSIRWACQRCAVRPCNDVSDGSAASVQVHA